ncbi:terminase small subunit [uncultured Granulicatella sp.]|uniref:terminase small subunit n=1 Tax=uncultured Granulicatella sp. TaxID=316089 RepID=UPI0026065F08|nr:terminase small subunit [uncultured Granulicatella sp.]
MSKLTTKQELFVQQIIAGQSQRQAYKQAYNAEKMTDVAIDVQASKLLKNPKVALRYRELLKQFSNMALWSREQAFNEYEWLKNQAKEDIKLQGVRQANSNAFVNALEGMNKMAVVGDELVNEKLQQEIEVLKSKVTKMDESNESKVVEYLNKLGDELDEFA